MHSFTIFLNVLTKFKNTVVIMMIIIIVINTHVRIPDILISMGRGRIINWAVYLSFLERTIFIPLFF